MSLDKTIKEKEKELKNANKQLSEAMASFKFIVDGMSLEPSTLDVARLLNMTEQIKLYSQKSSVLSFMIKDLKKNKRKRRKSIDKLKEKK